MKEMKPINPKWHGIVENVLYCRCYASDINEAWEKTLAKWMTFLEYPKLRRKDLAATCGLCNLFWSWGFPCEEQCPVKQMTGRDKCAGTPLDGHGDKTDVELEYLFLLLVREATKNG